MTAPGRRPTLKQVAARAGVATSTASLAFSGRGRVSADVVRRVHAAADDLGYSGPDPLASSLRRGRAGVIGVVSGVSLLRGLRDPFALSLLDGIVSTIDRIAVASGGPATGLLLIAQSNLHPERAVDHISGTALDAVLFSAGRPRENPLVDYLDRRGVPMVGTGAPVDPRVNHLTIDDRAAQAEVCWHLRRLGHTRVAHVMLQVDVYAHADRVIGPVDPAVDIDRIDSPDVQQRALGFLDVFPGCPIIQAPGSIEGGQVAARTLLALDERPTAIIAQADMLAAGAVRAAEEAGLRVPEDVSITGFDGVPMPWLPVELTTIDQDGPGQGRRIAEMLLALAAGESATSEQVGYKFITGNSTAPAPR